MAGKGKLKGKSRRVRSRFWSQKGEFDGVHFDSGLEKKFLDRCHRSGVKAVRSKVRVPYQDSTGKWHHYEPDFYLPDFDFTVEIKGMWAFKRNHAHVAEKVNAATQFFKGRFTVMTEWELKSDYPERVFRALMLEDKK